MASQVLEQMLEFAPKLEQTKLYETIDVYTAGTTALYTPIPRPLGTFSGFKLFGLGAILTGMLTVSGCVCTDSRSLLNQVLNLDKTCKGECAGKYECACSINCACKKKDAK